jgi:hypothetical protein
MPTLEVQWILKSNMFMAGDASILSLPKSCKVQITSNSPYSYRDMELTKTVLLAPLKRDSASSQRRRSAFEGCGVE